jgi:hypothetical protein
VNLGNLASRLRRDIQRSPQKAAILGLLALVAIWFWAPLMTKWFGGESDPQVQAAAAPDVSANTTVLTFTAVSKETPSTAETEARARPWNELLAWINEERLTKPATLAASFVDPFGRSQARQQRGGMGPDKTDEQRKLGDVDPRQLGLVLNSTVIGPTSRLASINGRICPLEARIIVTPSGLTVREPRTGTFAGRVPVGNLDKARDHTREGREHAGSVDTFVEYQLTEIQPTHVTLSRGAKSYRIDLKKFESNGGRRRSEPRDERQAG